MLSASIIALTMVGSPAPAAEPFQITTEEKAACSEDAIRLCADTYLDERRLLSFMQTNRSAPVRPVLRHSRSA